MSDLQSFIIRTDSQSRLITPLAHSKFLTNFCLSVNPFSDDSSLWQVENPPEEANDQDVDKGNRNTILVNSMSSISIRYSSHRLVIYVDIDNGMFYMQSEGCPFFGFYSIFFNAKSITHFFLSFNYILGSIGLDSVLRTVESVLTDIVKQSGELKLDVFIIVCVQCSERGLLQTIFETNSNSIRDDKKTLGSIRVLLSKAILSFNPCEAMVSSEESLQFSFVIEHSLGLLGLVPMNGLSSIVYFASGCKRINIANELR